MGSVRNSRTVWPLVLGLAFTMATVGDVPAAQTVAELIQEAGNADTDAERLACLRKLERRAGLGGSLAADLDRLIAEVERWIDFPNLMYFGRHVRVKGTYDFRIAEDSPLYPLTQLYQARMQVWVTLEHGGLWRHPDRRREQFDKIRPIFEDVAKAFPENRVVRMYLGEPIPSPKAYPAVPNAPPWAVYQREGLERLADIITWWIDHRMQENGEYGGGWGDDCEMWRWWTPVLVGFDDPKIVEAQARFSKALLAQDHMRGGYTDRLSDVEHTAEDSADALVPMMLLEPDNAEWQGRALRLAELMETLWSGANERGQRQFKSTYFTATGVDPSAQRACDTVYHPRAVAPALILWQRTGDAALGRLFAAWMDTWVDATARAERGKPAGIIPSAIHWPDGAVGGLGEHWWNPENHTVDPLYVWPSAMSMMTNTLLLTHHMTRDPRYLAPLHSMAAARLAYLTDPPEGEVLEGSEAWCAARMDGLSSVLGKYRLLTGSAEFDELLARDASPYLGFRLNGDETRLTPALEKTAAALRINFEGYTSEVRYTDRVLRFPAMFGRNGMYPDAVKGIHSPSTVLLYAMATGDPAFPGYFPLNAVRWRTPPRDIAALVTATGRDRFAARLFHFGDAPRSMAAELYLLDPGEYVVTLEADGTALQRQDLTVIGSRVSVQFELPPRRVCVLRVRQRAPRTSDAAPN